MHCQRVRPFHWYSGGLLSFAVPRATTRSSPTLMTSKWSSSSSASLSSQYSYPTKVRTESAVLTNPSFKVARIRYSDPQIETISMNTSQLLKAANIYARDLLALNVTSKQDQVESRFVRRAPTAVAARKKLILVSFGNIRAVVGLNDVFLLDAHRPAVQDFASEIQQDFLRRDKEITQQSVSSTTGSTWPDAVAGTHDRFSSEAVLPYELIFLERLLRDTVESFNRRVRLFEPIVEDFLTRVSDEVYSDTGVHQLVPLKDSLQSFEFQVKQSAETLAVLLDNDDAMLDLLLTEKRIAEAAGKEVDFERHEHVELLLGVYARQLQMTLMEIQFMLGRIQSKQEFVALALDSYRNRMVRMNVHVSIAGLSMGVGTTIAGFFGMNLLSGLEESAVAFYYVVTSTTVFAATVALASLSYISSSTMKNRAAKRLEEIETLSGALSDMCAVDYALKHITDRGNDVSREEFKSLLLESRRSGTISEKEVDLLFEVFDQVRNGVINQDDFLVMSKRSVKDQGVP